MSTTTFHTNTVLVSYNCHKQAIGFIRTYHNPQCDSKIALNVIVSCSACERSPHVHSPLARLRFKIATCIEYIKKLYQLPVPNKFVELDNGEDSKFFSREPACPSRRLTVAISYPGVDPSYTSCALTESSQGATNPDLTDLPPPYRKACRPKSFSEYIRLKELPSLPSVVSTV
jgi:hypothetical protein